MVTFESLMAKSPAYIEEGFIEIVGAREHNLKNISLKVPRNQLVVITGLSGSGKSSLAFDTIFAEGQRRYIESFSIYARQFLGNLERPDVDEIKGLSPVISIEQKTTSRNPRSTVGTVTEIYDYLRLLFARAATGYSHATGKAMVKYSDEQILNLILEKYEGKTISVLAPMIKGRKGHYRELFEQIRRMGYWKVRVDGVIMDIKPKHQLDRYKIHDIEIVIDRLEVKEASAQRLNQSIQTAMKHGKGTLLIDVEKTEAVHFSRNLMCADSGISYDDPAPNSFSFNSPYGACPKCNGLGTIAKLDIKKILPNKNLSIRLGGIAPLGEYKNNWIFRQVEAIAEKYGVNLSTPVAEIPEHALDVMLYGSDEMIKVKGDDKYTGGVTMNFEGIINYLKRQQEELHSKALERWIQSFTNEINCESCHGSRLKNESLYFKLRDKNIYELGELSIEELQSWFENIESHLDTKQALVATEVLKEIRPRLGFLIDVGLNYLTLNRSSKSLSGGEAQRIRLATQIGSALVGVLYILDEPSIGLHQRDNTRLINSLKKLRDTGNSVIVVEHDKEMIEAADYVIDIGPMAGINGGHIVAHGTPKEIKKLNTVTAQYLSGKMNITVPAIRRPGNGEFLEVIGAKGHNLKDVSVKFPLGKFICVTGVSGSGKSSLISETLYPVLTNYFYRAHQKPLAHDKITGLNHIDKIIEIDQSPIGRTPRSNPATYTNVFSDIRNLFAIIPEAQIRGYKPGRFSFNVKGGRCETCGGGGVRTIEMNFLPDVYVKCEACYGKRYNRETLEIRYKGKSISDVLDMTIDKAVVFFENISSILQKIKTLQDVGLGYITLGQSSTTLSGGEAQRVKLATELSKRDTGKTFYILDEPTTGLHFEDIRILLNVLNKLIDNGNTVLVIEHNMDIIKVADHIIDLGPEGGNKGGNILFEGTPEQMIKIKESHTAKYLAEEFINIKQTIRS